MNKILFLICLFFSGSIYALPHVSITAFKSDVGSVSCDHDWWWWSENLGNALRDTLAMELKETGKVEVLERENINEIYQSEHNLVNSQDDRSLKKGQFKKAQYTIVGSVSEYEYCHKKSAGSINVGRVASLFGAEVPDFSIGRGKASAKIAVILKLIDVETGRILKTVRGEGLQKRANFNFDSEIGGFEDARVSPMGEASKIAISKAASKLISAINGV